MGKTVFRTPWLLVRSLYSRVALEELYAARKALHPSEMNRTHVALVSCWTLFAIVMAFLMTMAWSRQDATRYLAQRDAMLFLDATLPTWHTTAFVKKSCASGPACLDARRGELAGTAPVHLHALGVPLPKGETADELYTILLGNELDSSAWKGLAGFPSLVLTLPSFAFRRADVFVNGEHQATAYDGGELTVPFEAALTAKSPLLKLEIVLEVKGNGEPFVLAGKDGMNRIENNLAVMTPLELSDFHEFIASNKAGKGDYVGAIARIVMAVFVLILFLLVDGSPETLGLGLFLGFEGVAISMRYGWLPLENTTILQHFCYSMGDIFRVYFFLQIARLVDKKLWPWLLGGALISLPYGFLRAYGQTLDLTWPTRIPVYRDLIAGGIGVVVLTRAAWYLRDKKLPWRVLALLVAAVGAFEQVVDPLFLHIPVIHETKWFTTFVDALQPIGAWMLAFSAFINISTLENRVRVLSQVEARAQEIQHEMELGQTVQRAFLNVPELPQACRLAFYHEAMLYVSGDTYYVNWNKAHGKLSFLINDATGHGIQAALKASATSVIARSLWEERATEAWVPGKLATYDQQVGSFLGQMSENPDIPAMGGAELDLRTGELSLYRANFPLPLLLEPAVPLEHAGAHLGELWNPIVLPLVNRTVTVRQLKPGSILILTSDGFIDTSRRTREVVHYLRQQLSSKDETLNVDAIKNLLVKCDLFEKNAMPDDRTLLVFQWLPNQAA